MRYVVAPDTFTGSLSAAEAAAAIARGIRSSAPDADVVERPFADGGDGTLNALLAAGWSALPVTVHGPTGKPVHTRIARRDDVALVELASCCGRVRLPGGAPAPLSADTRGVGEALRAALADGARELVVAVGGSAPTDGGLGLLRSLGVVVRDAAGEQCLAPLDLARAATVDVTGLIASMSGARLVFAVDVRAPLLGSDGSARLFGPQKGATPAQVEALEAALSRWAAVLAEHQNGPVAEVPGAGAAGGVVAGALGVLPHVRIAGGAEFVLDATGLADELAAGPPAAGGLVIVGEGSLDRQSLLGKAPVTVARAAVAGGWLVAAVGGRVRLDAADLTSVGIGRAVSLAELARADEDPMRDAGRVAERAGAVLATGVA